MAYLAGPSPCLAVDPKALAKAERWDFELAYARELSKAAMGLPVDFAEEEMAAAQREIVYALERAESDAGFSERLRDATRPALAERRRWRETAALAGAGREEEPPLPPGEVDRAARRLVLFSEAPEALYDEAGRTGRFLSELDDFIALHGAELDAFAADPGSPQARLKRRRYPEDFVLAARRLAAAGGAAYAREALGPFDTIEAAALKPKVDAWLRGAP